MVIYLDFGVSFTLICGAFYKVRLEDYKSVVCRCGPLTLHIAEK